MTGNDNYRYCSSKWDNYRNDCVNECGSSLCMVHLPQHYNVLTVQATCIRRASTSWELLEFVLHHQSALRRSESPYTFLLLTECPVYTV